MDGEKTTDVLLAIPNSLLKDIDEIRKKEFRTRTNILLKAAADYVHRARNDIKDEEE